MELWWYITNAIIYVFVFSVDTTPPQILGCPGNLYLKKTDANYDDDAVVFKWDADLSVTDSSPIKHVLVRYVPLLNASIRLFHNQYPARRIIFSESFSCGAI